MFEKNDTKEKKESKVMEDKDAFDLIKQWAEDMEVRLRGKDLQALIDEIWLAVKKEKLVFDKEKEVFTYILIKPIADKNNPSNVLMSMIKISECDVSTKKSISKADENEALDEMIKAYCKDSEDNDIPAGYIDRIKDRDLNIISAVILGFFVQVVPGKK